MKKYMTALAILLIARTSAQNTFPATGKVGIGTAQPSGMLDVYQTSGAGTTVGSSALIGSFGVSGGTTNTINRRMWGIRTAGTESSTWKTVKLHYGVTVDKSFGTPGVDTRTWYEVDPYNDVQTWGNAQTTYLVINKGNVGVGTTTPSNKLTVNGDGRFEQGVYTPSVGFRLTSSATDLTNNSTWYGLGRTNTVYSGAPADGYAVQLAGYWGLGLRTAGGRLVMLKEGNVGIGTDNPTAKLAVNGTVKAREVTVTVSATDWPDYVFRKGYRLPHPDSLSVQINKLGHLPGIPSAQEVEATGINLGEMNVKLLEKVEELTLFVIQQASEIKQLKEEKRNLKSLIERIEKLENNEKSH
ncbi:MULTISPECIES: hypothetical protein [Chitinophagaceae]